MSSRKLPRLGANKCFDTYIHLSSAMVTHMSKEIIYKLILLKKKKKKQKAGRVHRSITFQMGFER